MYCIQATGQLHSTTSGCDIWPSPIWLAGKDVVCLVSHVVISLIFLWHTVVLCVCVKWVL